MKKIYILFLLMFFGVALSANEANIKTGAELKSAISMVSRSYNLDIG